MRRAETLRALCIFPPPTDTKRTTQLGKIRNRDGTSLALVAPAPVAICPGEPDLDARGGWGGDENRFPPRARRGPKVAPPFSRPVFATRRRPRFQPRSLSVSLRSETTLPPAPPLPPSPVSAPGPMR